MSRLVAVAGALVLVWVAPASAATCPGLDRVKVPGAELQELYCLDDLSTAGTSTNGRTDQSDWSSLHASGTRNPSGIPGLQAEGYFPDTSTTNPWQARNHDAQYVIRLPNKWNGKLVITGAPGVRRQYANDFIISDWVLDRGYAFASTDKGNTGTSFYTDGVAPGDAVVEWHRRVRELTLAAKEVVAQRYGRGPARTYMTGISNGGYLTRYALEHSPELYDGGVDWEGTLMQAQTPNIFTYLPAAIRNYARWRAGDEAAHKAILDAGFSAGSEFLWDYHEAVYWDLTQRTYREEFDPEFDGDQEAGTPFCQSGAPQCDADYDYASRPQAVKDAVAKVANSGRIGKPLLTLHGDEDALLPIKTDSDIYTRMVRDAGLGERHRYYVITGGNHVDGLRNDYGARVRPILPCYRAAFLAMERWVESDQAPPPSQTVPRQTSGDEVNECTLAGGGGPASAPSEPSAAPESYTAPAARAPARVRSRVAPRGLSVRVSPRRDRTRPYRFRTSGRLLLPKGMAAADGCRGRVSVQVRAGRRTISTRRARVRSTCTFASRLTLRSPRRLGRGRLSFTVRFLGNDAVRPYRAKARRVRAR